MGKSKIDPKVSALVKLKSMISNIRIHSLVIAFDESSNLIYMVPNGEAGECFRSINDPELLSASKEFHNYMINTPETVGFNKALKKTKTEVKEQKDKSLLFTTDGYTESLTMTYLPDYTSITKNYSKLFKDREITRKCLIAMHGIATEWLFVTDNEFERLKNNELVILMSSTSDQIFVSKSIFGGLKKTKSLSHTVIQTEEDSELVLFRLEEDGYCIYKLIRYLTNL